MRNLDKKLKRKVGALGVLGILILISLIPISIAAPNWDESMEDHNDDGSFYIDIDADNSDIDNLHDELFAVTKHGGSSVGTELFRVQEDGRVGINDDSPDFKLEVGGSSGSGYLGVTSSSDGDIFVIDSDGDVGISRTSPVAKLEVADTTAGLYGGTPVGYFGTDTSDKIALVGDSTPSASINLPTGLNIAVYGRGDDFGGYFDGKGYFSGDVGIGTTSPASKLSVYGGVSIGGSSWAGTPAPSNGMIVEGIVGIGSSNPIAKTHIIQTAGLQDAFRVDDELVDTSPFIIDKDGDVGIGAWPSGVKLSVVETSNLHDKGVVVTHSGALALTGYGMHVSKTGQSGVNVGGYFSASGATHANYGLIVENGYVGIGKAADPVPDTGLDVKTGVTGFNNYARGVKFEQTLTSSGDNNILIGLHIKPNFVDGYSGGEHYALLVEDGDVGIGTTSPSHKVEINDDSSALGRAALTVEQTGDQGITGYGFGIKVIKSTSNSNGAIAGYFSASGGTNFNTGIWVEDGNVGIGKKDPSNRLHVVGNTYISGNLGIGATTQYAKLDIDGGNIRIRDARTITNSDDPGYIGEICWDDNYIYVCTSGDGPDGGTDTWERVAIDTW